MDKDSGILNPATYKNLSDNNGGIRKRGALEIEQVIKSYREANDIESVKLVVKTLNKLTISQQPPQRKGGLLALAQLSLTLQPFMGPYEEILGGIVPIVMASFADHDATVRFHSCETMYNIVRSAKEKMLQYFPLIFDGLAKLVADNDSKVKEAASQLDRIMKDTATEYDDFNVESFVAIIKKHIHANNSHVRQFLVQWLRSVESVPDSNLLHYLPEFLSGLLSMLSGSPEIVKMTETLLEEFKQEMMKESRAGKNPPTEPSIKILLHHCTAKEDRIRHVAIQWLNDWLSHDTEHRAIQFSSDFIQAILPVLSDHDEKIRSAANLCNETLIKTVQKAHSKEERTEPSITPEFLNALRHALGRPEPQTRAAAARWMLMLVEVNTNVVLNQFDQLCPLLIRTLGDACSNDTVQSLTLAVLSHLSTTNEYFQQVMKSLIQLFKQESSRLMTRQAMSHIVRQLSVSLGPEQVFRELSRILECESGTPGFVEAMVSLLNMILLTSAEATSLRGTLKQGLEHKEALQMFEALYKSWAYCSVSCISLCFLSGAYEHAYHLICALGNKEVTLALLTQVDKLVQLLESPVFIHLRLELLEPHKFPYLIKSLFGLLMILPQSSAYDLLKNRLQGVAILGSFPVNALDRQVPIDIDWEQYIEHFKAIHSVKTSGRSG